MNDWIAQLLTLLERGHAVVRIAVAGVRGSAPRDIGASMLCWLGPAGSPMRIQGSIGGGHLEQRAMEVAQELLQSCAPAASPGRPERRRRERFTLGASLGQCCGGIVELYWERFDMPGHAASLREGATRMALGSVRICPMASGQDDRIAHEGDALPPGAVTILQQQQAGFFDCDGQPHFVERLRDDSTALWIHGAGHVGQALVHVLEGLPFSVTWLDSRPQTLDSALAHLAPTRRRQIRALVEDELAPGAAAPEGTWHLVMTHCHDLDLRICEAVFASRGFGYLGLIGSATKAARFRHRLAARGFPPEQIARMHCPIGLDGIHRKEPAAIAISVVARLLLENAHECHRSPPPPLVTAPALELPLAL